MIYKRLIHFALAFSIFAVAGCSTHIALKNEVRSSVRSAEVSQEVKVPDRMAIGKSTLYNTGLVGAIATIVDRPDKEKAEKMDEMLRVEIPKTVYERFSTALKESKLFQQITDGSSHKDNADAVFLLTINSYGFNGQKPLLCATGRLILNPPVKYTWTEKTISVENPERHSIVWEKHACEFGQFVELPTKDVKFYVNNPDITKDAFTKASQSVVDQLIKDMKETYE